MNKFDRGSTVVIEIEIKKYTPYGLSSYHDPTETPTISILDPNKVERVSEQNLIRSDTGKYYYYCQTRTNWPVGIYQAIINCTDGSYDDVTINNSLFELE